MLNGKLTRDEGERPRDRVIYTTRFEDLGGADAVIEAVIEDATLKREVFARLDEQVPDADFLAPNTSSIPIAELAAATSRPQRVLGLCFFSPVPVMRLVEVVAAIDAAETALAAAEESPVTSESARSAPRTARGSSSTRCGSPT
jgi:3-hydroxybutyryl-CoA dehydrogenase